MHLTKALLNPNVESTPVDRDDILGASTEDSIQDQNTAHDHGELAFFLPDLTVGGAEKVAITLANGLAARGHTVDLVLSEYSGELRSQLSDRISVVDLPPSRNRLLGVAAHLPALATYLEKRQPDILFPHMSHVSAATLILTRILDTETAVVPTHHKSFGMMADDTVKDRLACRLVTHLYPTADELIAVSGGVADSIAENTSMDRADISVLYNPIDVATVREQAQQPVDHEWIEDDSLDVVLFVGRIEQQKDLETWLRSFEQVHAENPDTRAVITGQGSQRERISALADRLGLADVVSLPGYVDNPYRYMGEASVFVLSSRYEGLPTVLIEALACGCPVVATDCPSGPREILVDGTYGPLLPVGDVSGLARAVSEMLEHPVSAERLQARADEFAPDTVLDEYERFIQRTVNAL